MLASLICPYYTMNIVLCNYRHLVLIIIGANDISLVGVKWFTSPFPCVGFVLSPWLTGCSPLFPVMNDVIMSTSKIISLRRSPRMGITGTRLQSFSWFLERFVRLLPKWAGPCLPGKLRMGTTFPLISTTFLPALIIHNFFLCQTYQMASVFGNLTVYQFPSQALGMLWVLILPTAPPVRGCIVPFRGWGHWGTGRWSSQSLTAMSSWSMDSSPRSQAQKRGCVLLLGLSTLHV